MKVWSNISARGLSFAVAALLLISLPLTAAPRRRAVRTTTTSPFGVMMVVNNHTALSNASRAIERAHEAGIQWIRIGLAYAVIEPQKGSFQWSTYDTLVEKARSEQLQIVATLAYATQWNTTAPASELRAAQREHYPPASLDEWASYVRSTVTRYRSVIHHWEVWNEPDLGGTAVPCNGFWCGTAAQYAQLLHVTYDAIKEADPAASVLLGGLSLSTADGYRFGSEILNDRQYPAARSFDIMNVHVYGSQQEAMRRMSGIQAALAAAGVPNRPIWITEMGYSSDPGKQNVAGYSGGEAGQAAYLHDFIPMLLHLGAQKVFWFQLIDDDPITARTDQQFSAYGLLKNDTSTKQAFAAYEQLIAGR